MGYDGRDVNGGYRMKKLIKKYGLVNCIIALLCIVVLVINSLVVDKSGLFEISDNITIAYILNFLASYKGVLSQWGSMSFEKAFVEGQVWRCVTHIYLHAGLIHMAMNLVALIIAGKYVEKKYGSVWYVLFFHIVAIADAIILACIFPSESIGASEGIFAVIGVLIILLYRKQISIKKSEIIYLIAFFIISLVLGIESFVTHLIALVMGLMVGLVMKNKC